MRRATKRAIPRIDVTMNPQSFIIKKSCILLIRMKHADSMRRICTNLNMKNLQQERTQSPKHCLHLKLGIGTIHCVKIT